MTSSTAMSRHYDQLEPDDQVFFKILASLTTTPAASAQYHTLALDSASSASCSSLPA